MDALLSIHRAAAYPIDSHNWSEYGMTKYEAVATAAMQGLLANPNYGNGNVNPKRLIEDAILYADMLLSELQSKQE